MVMLPVLSLRRAKLPFKSKQLVRSVGPGPDMAQTVEFCRPVTEPSRLRKKWPTPTT
jgi:hypothetical protein